MNIVMFVMFESRTRHSMHHNIYKRNGGRSNASYESITCSIRIVWNAIKHKTELIPVTDRRKWRTNTHTNGIKYFYRCYRISAYVTDCSILLTYEIVYVHASNWTTIKMRSFVPIVMAAALTHTYTYIYIYIPSYSSQTLNESGNFVSFLFGVSSTHRKRDPKEFLKIIRKLCGILVYQNILNYFVYFVHLFKLYV